MDTKLEGEELFMVLFRHLALLLRKRGRSCLLNP